MRKLFIRYPAPRRLSLSRKASRLMTGALLAPYYFVLAAWFRVPGLRLRPRCAALALHLLFRGHRCVSNAAIFVTLFWPMDSTRYFEFDFIWRRLLRVQPNKYLDVSSPRLFPLMLIRKQPSLSAHLINPDSQDLEETKRFAAALGLGARCTFERSVIDAVPYADRSFDLITCISVLEHIPDNISAVSKMWNLLKPGGRLFITVPCLATAAEQYVDANLYGLAVPKEEDYSFLQYYYDDSLLRQFIFSITGEPAHFSIYGEKVEGSFRRYVNKAIAEPFKDRWKDPYRMGKEFKSYDSIAELPGEGVIAMEFVRQ
jgi:ubiquinone/menaquinone biosynthesis C-methylase UbiE